MTLNRIVALVVLALALPAFAAEAAPPQRRRGRARFIWS
jgi:hypothetical protein